MSGPCPRAGGAEDFQVLLDRTVSSDPSQSQSLPTRAFGVFATAWGACSAWAGSPPRPSSTDEGAGGLPIPGTSETSLTSRLPAELRGTAADLRFDSLPFVPLYRTDDEFAAEVSNQTVHGVMHLAWVEQGEGRYQGQMAVYVKPRGQLGKAYMALIKPFRHWVVYPALMRQMEREWNSLVTRYGSAPAGPKRRGRLPCQH